MKPLILATLAVPLALLSACTASQGADLVERTPTSQASPCTQTSNLKFTEDSEGFKDPDHAIRLLSTCLSSWPDAPTRYRALTLQTRAVAHRQKKDYTHAIADLEESLRLAPARTGWDIIGLASDYRDGGQPERAVELLRTMLQDNMGLRGKGTPPGMPSYYHLGRSLLALQQWSSAADAFSEGMNYQPDYVWAYAYRSLAYDRMEQSGLAQADLDKVRSLIGKSKPDARKRDGQILQEPPFVELLTKYPGN
ncbi:tetratricopeptide repeat protein [Achromobacter seleniivolatilans]|uniref:Tetratricopeptide repeat protein n=1 Tax=Achromobacter seleniivolatilans TaxID=3047478 RepID=A0ABY9M5W5_9BURK|nr:tetratricopeptide repeat protein [Achromobacter sp. R39]WMD21212.1 tetratricopeptide repeat protein [Achromobacter sp. R39]